MYTALLEIDDSNRADHYYLEEGDHCYYMGEYESGAGYGASATNSLISNFKKLPSKSGQPGYHYKGRAIKTIASCVLQNIPNYNEFFFVPIPPSKATNHPEYDDRLIKVLEKCHSTNKDFQFGEVIKQNKSFEAEHTSDAARPTPGERIHRYQIDTGQIEEKRTKGSPFIIFDDVLNTGSHFKAVQAILREHFPKKPIYGVFVARVARPDPLDFLDAFND